VISYKLINNHTGRIIVILPKAAATFLDHQELINLLGNKTDILFIETGYFGISKTEKDDPDLSSKNFCESLHKMLSQWNYQEIIFLAESVGANHALIYTQKYPEKVIKLILSNPALYLFSLPVKRSHPRNYST
jgi:pimeloyl-ACP methyl ester carboxylesterase